MDGSNMDSYLDCQQGAVSSQLRHYVIILGEVGMWLFWMAFKWMNGCTGKIKLVMNWIPYLKCCKTSAILYRLFRKQSTFTVLQPGLCSFVIFSNVLMKMCGYLFQLMATNPSWVQVKYFLIGDWSIIMCSDVKCVCIKIDICMYACLHAYVCMYVQ